MGRPARLALPLGTDPHRRRAGLGRALVSAIETRLRALGCPKLNLLVWEDNDAAMAFWLALGYRREPTVEFANEL